MSRAVLNELITTAGTGAIVPTGTQVTVYEIDGVTLLAATMYTTASGFVTFANPLATTSAGRVLAYIEGAGQRCILKIGTTSVLAQFFPDPTDVAAYDGTGTFTASKFENLGGGALVDTWGTGASGAGSEYIGLSRGSVASPPASYGQPMVYLQDKVKRNQTKSRQAPTTLFLETDYAGSTTVALRTINAGSGASTTTTLNDSAAGAIFTPSALIGQQISLLAGTASAQYRKITANTTNTLTVDEAWDGGIVPVAGSTQYAIGDGMSPQVASILVNAHSTNAAAAWADGSGQEVIGVLSQARRLSGNSNMYGALLSVQAANALANLFGLEIDLNQSSGANAAVNAVGTLPNRTIGINLASLGTNNNTLGILVQSAGATGALYKAFEAAYNSVSNYTANADPALVTGIVLDFQKLSEGTTTPKLIRAGSGHTILIGRVAANNADVDLLRWASDILMAQANDVRVNDAAGNNIIRFTSAQRIFGEFSTATVANRLAFQSSTGVTTNIGILPGSGGATTVLNLYNNPTPASGQLLEITAGSTGHLINSKALSGSALATALSVAGVVRFQMDTTGLAFFDGTPIVKRSAYDQTPYATASRNIANVTATALTAASGTSDGTVADVGAAFSQTTLNNNFKDVATAINALVADLANVKQNLNSAIGDIRAFALSA